MITIGEFLGIISPFDETYLKIIDNDFDFIDEGYAEDIDKSYILSGLHIDTLFNTGKNTYVISTEELKEEIDL